MGSTYALPAPAHVALPLPRLQAALAAFFGAVVLFTAGVAAAFAVPQPTAPPSHTSLLTPIPTTDAPR